jgi:hypothetical protein
MAQGEWQHLDKKDFKGNPVSHRFGWGESLSSENRGSHIVSTIEEEGEVGEKTTGIVGGWLC